VLLAFLGRPAPLLEESAPWYGQAIFALGSAGAPILGALIASRRPENLYGWLWLGFGLALAILAFGGNYAEYAVLSGNLPAPVAVAAVGSAGWVMWVALTPFLMLLFPDGLLPSPRWRFLAWTVVAAGAVCIVLGPFMPGQSGIASVENPFGVEGRVGEAIMGLNVAGVFVIFGCILLSALSLVFRFRRAGGVERQQIKWLAYAAVLFGGSLVFSGFLGRDLPGLWDAVFETVTLSGLYVAVGVAILRHRLYDIDIIINRTLVYGSLTASLALVYFGVVVGLQRLLSPIVGENNQLAVVASTLAIAALFTPFRRFLQNFIDRRFYRQKYDAAKTLEAFSARLREETDIEDLSGELVEVARETVHPAHASLWLRTSSDGRKPDG
jgi:hypothetical protein